jgi:hypothetical protein
LRFQRGGDDPGVQRIIKGKAIFALVAPCMTLAACDGAPSVNLLGAFFPSWMLCVVIGIALTLAGSRALLAAGLERLIEPRGVLYPALVLAFTLAAWLAFFRG